MSLSDYVGSYGQAIQQPAVPPPNNANLVEVAQRLKEITEVWQGARGDGLDRVLTVRDLLNIGLVDSDGAASVYTYSGQHVPTTIPTQATDPATPPTPTNLFAIGGVGTIVVSWDFPSEYTRLTGFELWRSATNALGDAVLIAQPLANIYADEVDLAAANYYWVRAISDSGISPFNAVDGTLGETAPAFEDIEAGTNNGEDYAAGIYLRDVYVRNGSIVEAKIGDAEITTAKIRDLAVHTAKINDLAVTTGKINDLAVTTAKIANLAVQTAQIANLAVTTGKIDDLAVTTAKIEDAAITTAKIEDAAITNAKIGDAEITAAKIVDLEVTNAKIGLYIASNDFNGGINESGNITAEGSAGWALGKAGKAVFSDVNIRGTSTVGRLNVTGIVTGSVSVPNNTSVTVTHGSGRIITLTTWSPDGSCALSDVNTSTFSVRLDNSSGGTVYFSYI